MGIDLNGKVALVTGSSTGVGRVIALKFSEYGADVVVNGRSPESGLETVNEIQDMGKRGIFEKADISVFKEVKEMVDRVLMKMYKIDILVVSGGVTHHPTLDGPAFFREIDPDTYWDWMITQYISRLYCVRAVLDHMIERKSGKIVLIGTDAGRWPTPGESLVGGAGAALVLTTKVLASEFARWGIDVNYYQVQPKSERQLEEVISAPSLNDIDKKKGLTQSG